MVLAVCGSYSYKAQYIISHLGKCSVFKKATHACTIVYTLRVGVASIGIAIV